MLPSQKKKKGLPMQFNLPRGPPDKRQPVDLNETNKLSTSFKKKLSTQNRERKNKQTAETQAEAENVRVHPKSTGEEKPRTRKARTVQA